MRVQQWKRKWKLLQRAWDNIPPWRFLSPHRSSGDQKDKRALSWGAEVTVRHRAHGNRHPLRGQGCPKRRSYGRGEQWERGWDGAHSVPALTHSLTPYSHSADTRPSGHAPSPLSSPRPQSIICTLNSYHFPGSYCPKGLYYSPTLDYIKRYQAVSHSHVLQQECMTLICFFETWFVYHIFFFFFFKDRKCFFQEFNKPS